ncbi:hypothetical protein IFR05_000670 [Cadophora sp. M221]|nr:hypothetical protein IFR05_000670 [Cadophora sp. M221]
MVGQKNPVKLQSSPKNPASSKIPLVLIHDGGGTTFAYHCLGSLQRDVYGIHNPKYESGEEWEGGMREMALCYIELLEDAGIEGPIIIGGWSLGGLLSIEIIHLLSQSASSQKFSIKGLLLIDTIFHVPWKLFTEVSKPELGAMPKLVRLSLDQCAGLLNDWELPLCDPEAIQLAPDATSNNYQRQMKYPGLGSERIYHQPLTGNVHEVSVTDDQMPPFVREYLDSRVDKQSTLPDGGNGNKLPPAVLIRAAGIVPDSAGSDLHVRADLFRDNLLLGWEFSSPDFIKGVIDVDGSHYDMFAFSRVKALTMRFNQALEMLGY